MTSEPGKEQERHLITNLMALEKSKERVREHMIYTSTIKRKALLNGPSTPIVICSSILSVIVDFLIWKQWMKSHLVEIKCHCKFPFVFLFFNRRFFLKRVYFVEFHIISFFFFYVIR